MIYELRVYTALPGRLPDLLARSLCRSGKSMGSFPLDSGKRWLAALPASWLTFLLGIPRWPDRAGTIQARSI